MHKQMLMNVVEKEEARVAVLEDGTLEELYIERASRDKLVGNIYKAKVVNVEPNIQAAFVDFGRARNGFLHASDIHASCYSDPPRGGSRRRTKRNSITDMVKRGQELIVQVSKAAIRNKAPGVTTYVSLPGRYLVLMPQIVRHGVSRKIEEAAERQRLKQLLADLDPPEGMGFIVRTAGAGRTKREIGRDLQAQLRFWSAISKNAKKRDAPALLYQETDLVIRTVRDLLTTDVTEMLVDSREAYQEILDFMRITMPRQRKSVKLYTDPEPIFHKFGIEEQIDRIYQKKVPLAGGASVVIDQTEALVAIDVNSGRFKSERDAEQSAYTVNMAAAREIARQIRLRDLGGIIVIDFIDMLDENHRREVERALWEALRRDRARTRMLRMSRFCMVEMTRQRVREDISTTQYRECPLCRGAGHVKTVETLVLETQRRVQAAAQNAHVERIEVAASLDVAEALQNEKRREIAELEREHEAPITVMGKRDFGVEKVEVICYKDNGKRIMA